MIPVGILAAATPRRAGGGGGGSGDPYWSSVVSLLHFDGANDSTVFTDKRGHAWSRTGGARIDTSQSRFGGSSLLVPGGGSSILSDNSPSFNLPDDFTIEAWVRPLSLSGLQYVFDLAEAGVSGGRPGLYLFNAGFDLVFSNTVAASATGGLTARAWHHLACERHENRVRLYINGKQAGATGGSSFELNAVRARLGVSIDDNFPFNGHIDEFRITRAARYKGNFTPPAEPFPDGP